MRRFLFVAGAAVCLCFAVPQLSVSPAVAHDAIPVCSYGQLEVAVAWGPGAAAGNIGIPFLIANVSKSTCTLDGYPKLLLSPNRYRGHSVRVVRSGGMIFRSVKPRLVTLTPGGDASFGLNYGDASNQNDPDGAPCLVQNIYVALPVRTGTFNQNFETTENFNFCFAAFQVGITAIEPGPRPREG